MNKSTLINVLAEKTDLSKRNSEQFVNLMVDAMISAMTQEDRIEIRGFGSFCYSSLRCLRRKKS